MPMRSSQTSQSMGRRAHKPIVIFHGDKGGVGKSFVARITTGLLVKKEIPVAGFDGDPRNGHLERFYGKVIPITRCGLRDSSGWADIYAEWDRVDGSTVILLDLPGNFGEEIAKEAEQLIAVADALKRPLLMVWAAEAAEDSVWLLKEATKIVPAAASLVVLNDKGGSGRASFHLWDKSKTRMHLLSQGGREAFIPQLPRRQVDKIDSARTPFCDVAGAGFIVPEQVIYNIWWSRVSKEMACALDLIGGAS